MLGCCPNCATRITYAQAAFSGKEIECRRCQYALNKRTPLWLLLPGTWAIIASFQSFPADSFVPWLASGLTLVTVGFGAKYLSRVRYSAE